MRVREKYSSSYYYCYDFLKSLKFGRGPYPLHLQIILEVPQCDPKGAFSQCGIVTATQLKPCKYRNNSNRNYAGKNFIYITFFKTPWLRLRIRPLQKGEYDCQSTLTFLICTGAMGSSWELLQIMVCPFWPLAKK